MPHPSRNSPSPLAHIEADDTEKAYIDNSEFTEINPQTEETSEAKEWFYGTEELLDALPKVWTRSLVYMLTGFVVIIIPWSILSKVDETGSARGRIEPKGATQKLDSRSGGSVTAVKVKEGDNVRTGQILLELESDVLQTDLQQAEAKFYGLQNQQAQQELLKNQLQLAISVQEQQNKSQELEKIAQINQARQNLEAKQSSYNLQKLEKQSLVSQAQQQISTSQNDQKSALGRLSIDSRQVERFSQLVKDGAVSVNQIDQLRKEEQESKRLYQKAQSDVKQAQLRLAEELSRYQTTINQLESDIKQAKLRLQEEQSSYQSVVNAGKLAVLRTQEQLKSLQTQIGDARWQIVQTRSQIISLKLQLKQRIVRSPVDGMIFELPVSKPGEVLQPGQRIAQIAPKNAGFVLKANIPSTESGFLKVGMPVKIKFDAYPFQEYGIVQGRVNWISPDTKVQQTPQGNIESFELEITLDKPYIQNGNQHIQLSPGQTATAEVIVRQRRVIDFILEPFQKFKKGGIEL
ncbi:HlyD family efflux transporter periplasmic adaptor subunit [Hassallia byssoidea VB512170]|uniref:HlyD family efflux transporter periplasmic adaptor subunit n=1 Tax=Hassallia byssoidea VB512170 TaxID=1304833 RepID=A0A846H5V9_9CYAN|nr:HlyD family efflux transporter periplasmic adaptor subunit [Hassalia byssoidea]NEU73007.1 HlyD family efflux transporter periplasmic adaptor subunit [Hassalia byssoidea VB512170]